MIVCLPPAITGGESAKEEVLVPMCAAHVYCLNLRAGTASARRSVPSGTLLRSKRASVQALPAESAELTAPI